ASQDRDIRQEAQAGSWGHSSWNFWDNDYEGLLKIVRAMKPTRVNTAGTAYSDVASRMATSIELIYKQAGVLAENWNSDSTDAGMKQLQKLYDQAREIHDKSFTTGSALTDHAKMQKSWQDSLGDEHWYGVSIGTGGTSVGDWLDGDSSMGRKLM